MNQIKCIAWEDILEAITKLNKMINVNSKTIFYEMLLLNTKLLISLLNWFHCIFYKIYSFTLILRSQQ
jgi:hypothetical protein